MIPKECKRLAEVDFPVAEGTFLLTRLRAASLKAGPPPKVEQAPAEEPPNLILESPVAASQPPVRPAAEEVVRLSLRGAIRPELWNKLGTRLTPKLRTSAQGLALAVEASLDVSAKDLSHVESDLHQALRDLGLEAAVQIGRNRV